MIPNAGRYNPTWYSETNDTSPFRFVRMTQHEFTGFVVEHKCSICGSVQIEGGFSIDMYQDTPYIVCKSCNENDLWVGWCTLCGEETPDCGVNGLVDYPNHWDAPPEMEHYQVICAPCWDASDEEDLDILLGPIDTPQEEPTMNDNIKDTLNRLEDKVDNLVEYLDARRAVVNDYLEGYVTHEEADEILERINQRLNRS